MDTMNQDWVLKRFREDTNKGFPSPYTMREDGFVWMSVVLNEGWYKPIIKNGRVLHVLNEAYGPHWPQKVGRAQERRILEALG